LLNLPILSKTRAHKMMSCSSSVLLVSLLVVTASAFSMPGDCVGSAIQTQRTCTHPNQAFNLPDFFGAQFDDEEACYVAALSKGCLGGEYRTLARQCRCCFSSDAAYHQGDNSYHVCFFKSASQVGLSERLDQVEATLNATLGRMDAKLDIIDAAFDATFVCAQATSQSSTARWCELRAK